MKNYTDGLTNQIKNPTDNKDTLNSDVQKFSTELFQNYIQNSFDAINSVYGKANENFVALTKITSPEDFNRYINNMSHTVSTEIKNFNSNAVNSFLDILAKYNTSIHNDVESLQDKVQSILELKPEIENNKTAKDGQTKETKPKSSSIPTAPEAIAQVPPETITQAPPKMAAPNTAKSLNSTKSKAD